jgi:hypothetical protein
LAAAAAVGEGNRGGGDSGDGDGGGGVTYKFVVERPTSISPLGIDVYAPRDAASLALGRVAVAAVVDGGAAHKAGLRAGDVLQVFIIPQRSLKYTKNKTQTHSFNFQ